MEPPRGRGKAFSVLRRQFRFRITPAWAGKSVRRILGSEFRGDHPRVGGEKRSEQPWSRCTIGSPPRGRGKDDQEKAAKARRRITPAWAGKRFPMAPITLGSRDHPRVGGEKHSGSCRTLTRSGSPPRGRGKAIMPGTWLSSYGITPAWAGKRRQTSGPSEGRGDHPRVGGEKFRCLFLQPADTGSPPRGRGKAVCRPKWLLTGRITPAWAGKRPRFSGSFWPTGDHPRVGGEKHTAASGDAGDMGSPPRGRGKVGHNQIAGAAHGITPAWTGKRVHEYKSGRFARDHPRMGGEKQTITRIRDANEGSPPHGRGKVCHVIYCLV